jgi:dynein heavy chain 1, cytosolic
MGDSLDNADQQSDVQNIVIVDYSAFANYLRKVVLILLPDEDNGVVPPSLNSALDDGKNQDCIRKFLNDPQIQALYVQRSCLKGMIEKSPVFQDV